MKASYPYFNPHCPRLPKRIEVPAMLSNRLEDDKVTFTYRENGAKVVRANLIYTKNGGHRDEEWFREPAILMDGNKVSAMLPKGTSHYFINLIDSNNFLVSYPEIDEAERTKKKHPYSALALKVK